MYELNTAEMIEIAKVVRDYQPTTPPPLLLIGSLKFGKKVLNGKQLALILMPLCR
jgi:hypothetical protein